MAGFMEVAEKILGKDRIVKAMEEFGRFRRKEGLFAREVVWSCVETVPSYGWWEMYGATTPILQALAMKVLAQVSSACACERNWSSYDFIHNKKRNKLQPQRARDLVYVFSNRRLLDKVESIGYTEEVVEFAEDAEDAE